MKEHPLCEVTENQDSVPIAASIGIFELILWRSRLLMGVGVVASVAMAVGLLYMAVIDTIYRR